MKTPQEAAREYANDNGFMLDEWYDIHNAFLAGAAFTTRWINVEDGLPENGQVVLCKRDHKDPDEIEYFAAQYVDDMFYINNEDTLEEGDEPTHWRPIEPVNK